MFDYRLSFSLEWSNTYIVLIPSGLKYLRGSYIDQLYIRQVIVKLPISLDTMLTLLLLNVGSSDSTIKVWDIIKQYYTHNFKGSSGVVR